MPSCGDEYGDAAQAALRIREGLSLRRRFGDVAEECLLRASASLAARQGQLGQAAHLLGAVTREPGFAPTQAVYDHLLAMLAS